MFALVKKPFLSEKEACECKPFGFWRRKKQKTNKIK